MKCQVCKINEAEQEHYITYFPEELKIDVCIGCHKKIHGHPVGKSRESHTEIIKDPPAGIRIPILSADLGLVYHCKHCGEEVLLGQSFINLILFRKAPSEPREGCYACKKRNYELILKRSVVMTKNEPDAFYIHTQS